MPQAEKAGAAAHHLAQRPRFDPGSLSKGALTYRIDPMPNQKSWTEIPFGTLRALAMSATLSETALAILMGRERRSIDN
jgi:hypothetical protein